eukprot:COSAG01_NODE_14_length_41020_cov_40.702133_25_plen_318_part_00
MLYLKRIERFFPVFLLLAVCSGFVFPQFFIQFESKILYFLMGIMTLLFLKIELIDILKHIRKPFVLCYISFIHLILMPFLVYWLFQFLPTSLRMSIVLLAALPAGVSSAVFTDIMKGRTSLNLMLVILTNLLAIITIPTVFYVLSMFGDPIYANEAAKFDIDYMGMLNKLSWLIFLPLLIAKILKRVVLKKVIKTLNLASYYNTAILLCLYFMISTVIAFQAEIIIKYWDKLIIDLLYIFLAFFIFQFVGYFALFWMKKGDKVAAANSTMIMNNVLGVVLALAFFTDNPRILIYITLSFIPWNIMIILKHWYLKYLP